MMMMMMMVMMMMMMMMMMMVMQQGRACGADEPSPSASELESGADPEFARWS
jgi:ABC-type cobalt transport system substrate-binding protein